MTRIGIIGAGHIGSTLARGLVDHGYDVVISNSRGPESLAALVAELGEKATAGTVADAADFGDVVIVTVPLRPTRRFRSSPLAGKIVLDTNNYYWERDGRIPALDEKRATTSGLLQEHLPDIEGREGVQPHRLRATSSPTERLRGRRTAALSRPRATARRRWHSSPVCTTSSASTRSNVGPLAESWRVERDQPAYVVRQTRDELVENLAQATR